MWPPVKNHHDCTGAHYVERVVAGEVVRTEGGRKPIGFIPKWPIHSDASGVHPSQIGEYQDFLKKSGCGQTEFDNQGRIVWKDREHKKRCNKALGLIDKQGYESHG